MWSSSLLLMYCLLIAGVSLAGGLLPNLMRFSHRHMQLLISFIGGVMLGVALFHQIPHATGSLSQHGFSAPISVCMTWTMVGLLTLFIMLRAFHFHHHGAAEIPEDSHTCSHGHHHSHHHPVHPTVETPLISLPVLNPDLAASVAEPAVVYHPAMQNHPAHQFSWVALTMGLVLHTFIDGMALAAAIRSESLHAEPALLMGLGTFLAIAMHKPLDSLSIASLMLAGGWPGSWRHVINTAYAAMCPLGALLFYFGVAHFTAQQHLIVGCALAFSAGAFMCISLSDLLPELEFHSHDRVQLTAALIVGVLLAWAIGFLEPAGHRHDPATSAVSFEQPFQSWWN